MLPGIMSLWLTLRASASAVQTGKPVCHSVAAATQLELFRVYVGLFQGAVAALLDAGQSVALAAGAADQQAVARHDGAKQRVIATAA
jgi:hypothetical protein